MTKSWQVQTFLSRLFYGCFFILFFYLTVRVCINTGNAVLFGAGALAYALGVVVVYKLLGRLVDGMQAKHFRLLMGGLLLAFFVLCLSVAWAMRTRLQYDIEIVYELLPNLLDDWKLTGEDNEYFLFYPHLIGPLVFWGVVYTIGGWFGYVPGDPQATCEGLQPGICANVVMIFLTVFFICKIARLLFGTNSGVLLAFGLCSVFIPFYTWSPVFYTHSLSLPFPVAAVYYYLLFRKAPTRKRYLWLALSGVCSALGFIMKGNVLIMAMAMCIVLALDTGLSLKAKLASLLVVVVVVGGLVGAYSKWQRNNSIVDFTDYEQLGLPLETLFLFGSHGTGAWDVGDRMFERSFPTVTQRKVALRERIIENYSAYTPASYLKFWDYKLMRVWGDGKYGSQEMLVHPYDVNWTQYFVFEQFFPFKVVSAHAQFYLLMMYLLGLIRLGMNVIKPRSATDLLLYVNLFGLMLFLSFWEAQAPYSLNYAPLLMLCAMISAVSLAGTKPFATLFARKAEKAAV